MEPEVVVNLWVFIQKIGPMEVIYELGVRPYVLMGSDDEMTRILKVLSISDFHLARRYPLPDRYYLETKISDGRFRAITGEGDGEPSRGEKNKAMEAIRAGRAARWNGLALVNPQISGMWQVEYFKEALDAMQASLPSRRLGIGLPTTRTPIVNRRNLLSVITRVYADEQGKQIAQVDDPRRDRSPSPIINLWMFHDQKAKVIYAVSGRRYMVHGSESDKARILRTLAQYDFPTVETMSVPEKFSADVDGKTKSGVLPVAPDAKYDGDLFAGVIQAIEHDIPTSIGIDGRMKDRTTVVASQPLSIATLISEGESNAAEAISVQITRANTPSRDRPTDARKTAMARKIDAGTPPLVLILRSRTLKSALWPMVTGVGSSTWQ
jgi:hypothetical protein